MADFLKWTSSAGPRNTKKVREAISNLSWRGKTFIEVTGIKGGTENRFEFTSPLDAPTAESIKAHNDIHAKYSGTVTNESYRAIVADLDEATKSLAIPEIDKRVTPAEEMDRRVALANAAEARKEASRKRATEVERIADELRVKYPWASEGEHSHDHVRAAKNIRKELKLAFPGVKFSVRSDSFSMGNSVDVSWSNGPTSKAVEEIIGKYQYGHFDGMEDIYRDNNSAFSSAVGIVLGQAKYVHGHRSTVDYHEAAGKALCEAQGVEYLGTYSTRKLFGEMDGECLRTHIHRLLGLSELPVDGTPLTSVTWDREEHRYVPVFGGDLPLTAEPDPSPEPELAASGCWLGWAGDNWRS